MYEGSTASGQCINPWGGSPTKETGQAVLYANCNNPPTHAQFTALTGGFLRNVAYPAYCLSSNLYFEEVCDSPGNQFQLTPSMQLQNVSTGEYVMSNATADDLKGGNTSLVYTANSTSAGTFTAQPQ